MHISDIHVSTSDTVQAFMEDIREMNFLNEKPSFVVATGDLVNNGNNDPEYENYRKAAAEFHLPLCNVIGNHDAPVVGDSNRIYISIQDDDNAINGGVVCLDREKGKIRWTFKSGVSINGTPAVSEGTVCAVSVTGAVFGLDASTGRELWRYNLGNSWERWVYNSPVISKGVVYCGVAPYFVALDLKTGKELWRGPSLGSDWISCRTSPESDSKNVYIGFNWSNGLFALDKKTGTVVWNKKEGCGSTHVMKPVVENNLLYYAADSKLYALEKATGKEVWNTSLEGGWPASSPAIKGLVLVTGTPGGQISAFNRETGKKTWSFQTGAGGEGGIRTHEAINRLPVFETGPFIRSGTSPD